MNDIIDKILLRFVFPVLVGFSFLAFCVSVFFSMYLLDLLSHSYSIEEWNNYAKWYSGWFLPAIICAAGIASDHNETKTAYGSAWVDGKYVSVSTQVPTGRVIPGNPDAGLFFFIFWLSIYPVGYLYYLVFWRTKHLVTLTRFHNLDLTLINVIVPITIIYLVYIFIHKAKKSDHPTCCSLVEWWRFTIGANIVNSLFIFIVIGFAWLLD